VRTDVLSVAEIRSFHYCQVESGTGARKDGRDTIDKRE
jgi:hypothetical protein